MSSFFDRLRRALVFRKQSVVRAYYRRRVRRMLAVATRPCLICDSMAFTLLFAVDKYGIPVQTQQCDACGFIMENPTPTKKFLDQFYISGMYRGLYRGVVHTSKKYAKQTSSNERAKMSGDFVRSLTSDIHKDGAAIAILDFGSGDNQFLLEMKEQIPGSALYGIEPGINFRKLERQKVAWVWNNIDELPAEQMFDVITLWHVVEHLLEPVEVLKKLGTHLRPGGLLMIEVPDADRYVNNRGIHIGHLYHFTPRTLTSLLAKAGFQTVLTTHDYCVEKSRSVKGVFSVV